MNNQFIQESIMDDDFSNIDTVMSDLMNDFDNIERSVKSIEEVLNSSAQYIQKRLGLYSVIVTRIEGDNEVFQSVFGSNKEYCDSLSNHPPRHHQVSTNGAVSRLVSNGQLMVTTAVSQSDVPVFFMDQMASDIWLPIKKKNIVIGIIKLGSRKTIQFDDQKRSDNVKAFVAQYEKLQERITEILENTF
jgi:putative methionine-R-sulfoxide reductase with GAF domain